MPPHPSSTQQPPVHMSMASCGGGCALSAAEGIAMRAGKESHRVASHVRPRCWAPAQHCGKDRTGSRGDEHSEAQCTWGLTL